MSTNDVPGHKASNNDVLAMGSWAESKDGSLIFVESVENGRVIYSMFDTRHTPVLEYRDAMPESDFKPAFSWKADRSGLKDKKASGVPADILWTWHDKTPFPWDRVIKNGARDGARFASAADTLDHADKLRASIASPADGKSDAARVAEAVGAAGQAFSASESGHLSPTTVAKVGGMLKQLGDRLERMGQPK